METDGRTEQIENWLIINWKSGSTRTRKSEPSASDLGTHELATRLGLEIIIPEVEVPELSATVEVPQPRVEAAALDDVDAEDAPDWHDVVEEVLSESPEATRDDADSVALKVLERAPDRPNVKTVHREVTRALRQREVQD